MTHDPNKVLLGGRVSSIADITNEAGDPRVFKAGTAVRLDTNGVLQLPGASPLIGVSMGESLTDNARTSVARVGNFIPVLLDDLAASRKIGDITFTAKVPGDEGNDITVTLSDVLDDGSASVVVMGTDIIISIESGVTEASAIVEAIEEDSDASEMILAVVDSGDEDAPQTSAVETALIGGVNFEPVQGSIVKIASNGKASSSGTNTSAVYVSERKTGVYPNRSTHPCALIGLIGGF